MQNQDSQDPTIDRSGRSASESPPSALAAAGRRRTQEQGQGDLDDDRHDPTLVDEAASKATDPAQSGADTSK